MSAGPAPLFSLKKTIQVCEPPLEVSKDASNLPEIMLCMTNLRDPAKCTIILRFVLDSGCTFPQISLCQLREQAQGQQWLESFRFTPGDLGTMVVASGENTTLPVHPIEYSLALTERVSAPVFVAKPIFSTTFSPKAQHSLMPFRLLEELRLVYFPWYKHPRLYFVPWENEDDKRATVHHSLMIHRDEAKRAKEQQEYQEDRERTTASNAIRFLTLSEQFEHIETIRNNPDLATTPLPHRLCLLSPWRLRRPGTA